MTSFGHRLHASFERYGQLCVGIDPHPWLLAEWDLPDSAEGAREFGLRVVEASVGRVGTVKPQVAFYERFGASGYAAIEDVIAAARSAQLLVIADVKRGDVGSTIEAYAAAWLTPGGPLEADAMTVSAFQGVGSLHSSMELAQKHGKGVFVLCATSNPEAAELQLAVTGSGNSVAQEIAAEVSTWNSGQPAGSLGSMGLVIGATITPADFDIALDRLQTTPILAPGFGYQGARFDQLRARYGVAAPVVLANVSRSVLGAGPDGIAQAITEQAAEVGACRV